MAYSNSSLITCTKLSPNFTSGRDCINRITWHHTATDQIPCARIGEIFANPSRGASCNYGVSYDGICLIVEEKNRAWTSSNGTNDRKAITFEISNSKYGEPWPIADATMENAIALTVDICRRNGINEVFNIVDEIAAIPQSQRAAFANNYKVPEGKCLMTQHNYFAATACPGTYIKQQFKAITDEINRRLKGCTPAPEPAPKPKMEAAKPTLKKAMQGAQVRLLQNNLLALGYSVGKWGADGIFGDSTRSAVIAFQKKAFPTQSKEWDGIYGTKTYNAMVQALANI